MTSKISKTNLEATFLDSRLDEIRMTGHERLMAKARMAQAEAIATAIGALFGWMRRALKGSGARSHRRAASSAG